MSSSPNVMNAICRNIELNLALERAEKELQLVEKIAKEAPKPQPIDTTYFHDVGVSLFSDHLLVDHLKKKILEVKKEKADLIVSLCKSIGVGSIAETGDGKEKSVTKLTLAVFSEIIERITTELSELIDTPGATNAGLRLFVHDRLGHKEPSLHFSSWEQRLQQRVAAAKDKVGKVRQSLIDVLNSASNSFNEHPLVSDPEKWTSFVSTVDGALVAVISGAINAALELYLRQFGGKNVRELFAVNLKLNQASNLVMIPTPQDLSAKLSDIFQQNLFSVCPENAIAHVVSRPTNVTKDPSISTRKKCMEDATSLRNIAALNGLITREICPCLTSVTESIQKEWGRYWSPSMISSDAPTLIRSVSMIQAEFVVNHPVGGGAILLNAFPLQDAILSMIHVQIENARDEEIKSLVNVWAKAVESKTTKEVSALTGSAVVKCTPSETRGLDSIGKSTIPSGKGSDGRYDAKITLDDTFDPLDFATRVIKDLSFQNSNRSVSEKPHGNTSDEGKKAEMAFSDENVQPAKGRSNDEPSISPSIKNTSHVNHSANPSPPKTSVNEPPRVQTKVPIASYTTMTVEEVKDAPNPVNGHTYDSPTVFASADLKPVAKPTQFAPSTPRDVSDSAAEFRRRVEEANNATAAAARRKEEMRQNSPRSPNRKVSLDRSPESPTKTTPQPPTSSSALDRRPSLKNEPPCSPTEPIKSIVKNASSSDLKKSQPTSSAPTARRTVEFDPKTTTGGNGPSAAFKKASAPPEDDDETILRKLMQKEKESMERIRMMKEKDELRRKELAAAHRRAIAEEETYVSRPKSPPPPPTTSTKILPPLNSAPSSGVGLDSPTAKRSGEKMFNSATHTEHTPSKSPERENMRPVLGAIRNPPSQQTTPRESGTAVGYSGLGSPIRNTDSAPLFVRTSNSVINDPLRPETLSRTSGSASGRPDSALRRKLALPSVQNPASQQAVVHLPAPPQEPILQSLRKPQTAPVASVGIGAGNTSPRTSGPNSSVLDPRMNSLLDIYKSCCSQLGIKPNSGLLKMLPKTVGENISKINLDLNYIGVRGFQPLLQILKVNRGLTFLNLKDNNLENNEIRSLVSILSTDSGDMLQHLDLSNNPISLAGGSALLDLIAKQKSLTSVVVSGTLIQPKMIEKISEAVASKMK